MNNIIMTNNFYPTVPPCINGQHHKFVISYPESQGGIQYKAQAICEKCGYIRKDAN